MRSIRDMRNNLAPFYPDPEVPTGMNRWKGEGMGLRRHKDAICEWSELLVNEVFQGPISEESARLYKMFFINKSTVDLKSLRAMDRIDQLWSTVDTMRLSTLRGEHRARGRPQRGGRPIQPSLNRLNFLAQQRYNTGLTTNQLKASKGKPRWTKAQKREQKMINKNKQVLELMKRIKKS